MTAMKDRPNGHSGSFAAPPSTIAAQLINDIATTDQRHRQGSNDLATLMTEVSNLENNIGAVLEASVKLEHKHKLIYVFTCAVLERLGSNDPFMNVSQLVSQASEALDIFILTITEIPEVLDFIDDGESPLPGRGQLPLWMWLFPKILALLGRSKLDDLIEKIKDFFHACFQVVARTPKLWRLSSAFTFYLKECVTALLVHTEGFDALPYGHTIVTGISSAIIEQLMANFEQGEGTATLGHTYTFRDSAEALWQTANILFILADISTDAATSYDATPACQDYLAFILDSFQQVHETQKRWRTTQPFTESYKGFEALSLSSIHALLTALQPTLHNKVLSKGYVLLANICTDLLEDRLKCTESPTPFILSSCFLSIIASCSQYSLLRQMVATRLVPAINSILCSEGAAADLGVDFTRAATALCRAYATDVNKKYSANFAEDFENVELHIQLHRLGLEVVTAEEVTRPHKRRKIKEADLFDEVIARLYSLLGAQRVSDLDGLGQLVEPCFTALKDDERCRAIEFLGWTSCAANGSLTVTRDANGGIIGADCSDCDASGPSTSNASMEKCHAFAPQAILVFSALLKTPAFLESKRPRVLAMITLKKFVEHFQVSELLNLEVSRLGQWCIKSLGSSTRELRIAASRTLPQFLADQKTAESFVDKNVSFIFNHLRSLAEQNVFHLQETCILAWGQIGRLLEDADLNVVLLQLVEYLGHSNTVISSVTFGEILKLAKARKITPDQLFRPYWDNIAIVAVQNILVRPQTTQMMADLLEITVPAFLLQTQARTLPWLVLTKKYDIIQRIQIARGDDEAFRTIMDDTNLAPILALLLVQNVSDMETFVMALLKDISPHFRKENLQNLCSSVQFATAFELLKAAGSADTSKKSRVHHGLQILVKAIADHNNSKRVTVSEFLGKHVLALVTMISSVLNDSQQTRSVVEKKQCIKTLEEMIKISKSFASTARPQICACLQVALEKRELQDSALVAWHTMLTNFLDEDVEAMLESTFATIIQRWSMFDTATQSHAVETLKYLLKHRSRLIRSMITDLPSMNGIPQLGDIEAQLKKLRSKTEPSNLFQIFARRVAHENSGVVTQALVELKAVLRLQQSFLQVSAVSEQPDAVVGQLVRSVLDACVKFKESHQDIAQFSAECLGLIGCLDPNRVEAARQEHKMIVISNFEDANETSDFVLFILQEVIVKAFLSATDTTLQGFLSFVMQELLDRCGFRSACESYAAAGERSSTDPLFQKWVKLPASVQEVLLPFMRTKYSITQLLPEQEISFPIFRADNSRPDRLYIQWLRTFVLYLLRKPSNVSAELVFAPLCRAIKIKDVSVASFLLPYVLLHVVLGGSDEDRRNIGQELLCVLRHQAEDGSQVKKRELKHCCEAVFRVIDYMSRWMQERQLKASQSRGQLNVDGEIKVVSSVLEIIPADIVSRQAMECNSYSRALFYWEQHIRATRGNFGSPAATTAQLARLQDIYTQIDEPDGIEGISAHLHVLDIDQQILGHRKAGRWTAAQSWYEIKLAEDPDDQDTQVNLLTCLRQSGQHGECLLCLELLNIANFPPDVLLNYVDGMHTKSGITPRILPFAIEASWTTGRWQALEKFDFMAPKGSIEDFNVSIGRAILALHKKDNELFTNTISSLRGQIARSMSMAATSSIGACHDTLLKFHVLAELEMIGGRVGEVDHDRIVDSLQRRLEVIGAYVDDKQYLLGIRRAAMLLSSPRFTNHDVAAAWLTSARLARKDNAIHQSFNAVLHASQLGDASATIEHARLLWKEGHHRKATQYLQRAIESNAFMSHNRSVEVESFTNVDNTAQQNLLTARAYLLLAKWQDSAGQTHSAALQAQYQLAARTHMAWEKGHYYLGRHYNKILEAQNSLPQGQQPDGLLTGQAARLVIENYLRSLSFGTKYIYQTLPRTLTLWLDLGTQIGQPIDAKHQMTKEQAMSLINARKEQFAQLQNKFQKYIYKLPAYVFYTALPQIVARIAHPNMEVFNYLKHIILKVVAAYPQQALWTLLAVSTSNQTDRRARGTSILQSLRASDKLGKPSTGAINIKNIIKSGERLTNELLLVCNTGEFHSNRTSWCSLTKDLEFKANTCTPNPLAMPIESALTATLPTLTDKTKDHQAFSRDLVTISSFLDEVMILSSLQKPRKLTAVGSDGKTYGLLCKPKDDLRKDQRLMEFNSMINRSLKGDAESSRRQLYIKTYAVTPLNEECGIIEWVDGLKTLREILLGLYKSKGISPNYREIEVMCDAACKSEATLPIYTEKVLGNFPPIFHQWFVSQFPEPSAWFTARLRYTRSCAVMSMVGTILGLGDRHGENILFEEGNGGTFHVDFNCLFDKGLTFARPEKVPFRLTHNMIDAMGVYGYEGTFRKSAELTLKLLRQHEETLMTILEAFVHDPTLDLLPKKTDKKKREPTIVPQTPQGVLDSIRRKVKGLLPDESVPLGVEGQVDELIKQATDQMFLASMYIGWCSFF